MDLAKDQKLDQLLPTFCKYERQLSPRGYWYMLGTIWATYSKLGDNELWRALFNQNRAFKHISLMKEDEYRVYCGLSSSFKAYRPYFPEGYSKEPLNPFIFFRRKEEAVEWASLFEVQNYASYIVQRDDVDACFDRLRPGELLVTHPDHVRIHQTHPLLDWVEETYEPTRI